MVDMPDFGRIALAAAVLMGPVSTAAPALAGTTERISISSSGKRGDRSSYVPKISADGRYVSFDSSATNLVPGDTNGTLDVFVRDRLKGTTERVSISSSGKQGNGGSIIQSISADGRFVAFGSEATNLVPGDTNSSGDIFVHDRVTGSTTRVSVSSSGRQGNDYSGAGGLAISAKGRFVAFGSSASNLVPGDTNGFEDVFVHDRRSGRTERVSISTTGKQGNNLSMSPSISANGRFVTFNSYASNLVSGDANGTIDVFIRDRKLGTTELISISSSGQQGNGFNSGGAISADGRFVAFDTQADNLVSGDTNGHNDVFVRDRLKGTTERVSISSQGVQGNDLSDDAALSANGRFVVFQSYATNLVKGDTNGTVDIFVRDRDLGTTERVSVSSGGVQADRASDRGSITDGGRFVAFGSDARNLVPGDANGATDIFVRTR